MNLSVLRALLAVLLLGVPGCLLLPPDQAFPDIGDDDDATGDDDDATGDDDDATGDDDDATDPPLPACEFDADLPGSQDGDGDGWPARSTGDEECDCDDSASWVFPGAAEVFDLEVNDCDATVSFEDLPVGIEAEGAQPGSLYDGFDGIGNEFGSAYSVGDLDEDGAADLCVRAQTKAFVLMDFVGAFMTDAHIDAFAVIEFSDLEPNGSIDCSADINGSNGTDVLINHWPDPVSDGGQTLTGGGQLLLFDGDEVASGLLLEPSDAEATFPAAGGTTAVAFRGLCLGVGDFAPADGVEVVIGTLPAINPQGLATYRVLGYDGTAGTPLLQSRGTLELASLEDPYDVSCYGLGDVSDGGRDDLLLNAGLGAELYFAEDLNNSPVAVVDFSGIDVTSATSADFTGDGIADLALGATWVNNSDDLVSAAAFIRGGLSPGEWTEVDGADGGVNPLHGVNFLDEEEGSAFGHAVCAVGDVDRDGTSELLLTAPGNDGIVGEARLYAGRSWTDWAGGATGDNGAYARGSETSRFTGSSPGGGMGLVGACDTALPRAINESAWPMVGEPFALLFGQSEISRLWTWEPYP